MMALETRRFSLRMLNHTGVWGPVTSTLDWCEDNYIFTPYIAEFANTLSNAVTVFFGLYGAWLVRREKLPSRFVLGFLGVALIGLGSFAFHATLLYGPQLADELPMVSVASFTCLALFDDDPGFNSWRSRRTRNLGIVFGIFNVVFSASYWWYRNPVYHEFVFGSIMFAIILRVGYLQGYSPLTQQIPRAQKAEINRLFWVGVGIFALGFLIWNLDNNFCDWFSGWRERVGWPLAFLFEGHAWWHVLTGIGTYLMCIGAVYLSACIKDSPGRYQLRTTKWYLPYLIRRRADFSKAKQ